MPKATHDLRPPAFWNEHMLVTFMRGLTDILATIGGAA